jgi:pimeloyl-ACP methyl ester carboxylesterase
MAGAVRLAVTDEGEGPAVVLLHGQPGGPADWRPVRARLAAGGFRVLTPDRPGYGRTGGAAAGMAANADAVAGVLDQAGVSSAVVAGHSWGGAVALLAAARHPARVGGLVLAGSVGPGFSPTWFDRVLGLPAAGSVLALAGLGLLGHAMAVPAVRRLVRRGLGGIDDDDLREAAAVWRQPGTWRAFSVEQRSLLAEAGSLAAAAGAVSAPTVVVHGQRDPIVPLARARETAAAIDRSRLVVVPGAGHLLPLEAPGPVAEAVASVAAGADADADR